MSNPKLVPPTTPTRSFMATVVERTIYHATVNSDDMEGKGSDVSRGYYIDPTLAHKAAGKGYTSKVDVAMGYTVEFGGKTYLLGEEVTMQEPQVTHDNAVAKIRAAGLTPEEARELGIQI